MIFSHLEFAAAAPLIGKGGNRLRGGRDLFFHQCERFFAVFMFEDQLGNIDIGAILIAGVFFDKFNELIAGAADGISHFQELRRLALINCVEGKRAANP